MEQVNIKGVKISLLSEEEIAEKVLKNLIDKSKFYLLFINTNVFFHILFDKEFREIIKKYDFLIIASNFIKFIISKIKKININHTIRESSTLFKILKNISDYYYRILVVDKSKKTVTKFKKHINLTFQNMESNLICLYDIFDNKGKKERIKTITKLEPDIVIFSNRIIKTSKFLNSNKSLLKNSSIIFSSKGVKIIAGLFNIFSKIIELIKTFLQSILIIIWFFKEEILQLLKNWKILTKDNK